MNSSTFAAARAPVVEEKVHHVQDDADQVLQEDVNQDKVVFDTFQTKDPVELNPRTLSSQELSTLKTRDAFMYYSIPEVRHAHMEGREVDLDQVTDAQVRRCSAISFESADLSLDAVNMFECNPNMARYERGDDDEEEDLFMEYLESVARAN
jgi:hypothetical protein